MLLFHFTLVKVFNMSRRRFILGSHAEKLISQPRHISFGFAYILPRSLKVLRRQNSEQVRPKTKQEGKKVLTHN